MHDDGEGVYATHQGSAAPGELCGVLQFQTKYALQGFSQCSKHLPFCLPQKEIERVTGSQAVRIRLALSPHVVDAELETDLEHLTSLVREIVPQMLKQHFIHSQCIDTDTQLEGISGCLPKISVHSGVLGMSPRPPADSHHSRRIVLHRPSSRECWTCVTASF